MTNKKNKPHQKGRQQRQSNAQSDRGHAHAPYNFVPLNDENNMLEGELFLDSCYAEGRHTGYFDVTLETKTPLFVRGMRGADMPDDTKINEPFMLNGKPVIPGSSLRGMIRAIVEIITFGKMHFVDDAQKIFFRAVAAEKDDPQGQFYKKIMGNPNSETHAGKNVAVGYLVHKDDKWFVQPAKPFDRNRPFALVKDKANVVQEVQGIRHLNSSDYCLARFEVSYQENGGGINKVSTPKNPTQATAWLVCTGNMAQTQTSSQKIETERKNFVLVKKAHENKTNENKTIPIPEHVIDDYKQGLTPFEMGDDEQSKDYFDKENGILKDGNIIFYVEKDNQVIQFGHTPNFRVAHLNPENRATSPRDFVPKKLLDPYFTDYADAIFGYVSDKDFKPTEERPVAYAGRVSFTSATYICGTIEKKKIIRVLSSPKPTTFQHYLEQPEGVNTPKKELTHYGKTGAFYDKKGARIRGHKLYWRKQVTFDTLQEKEDGHKDREKIDVPMKPLREGLTFNFRVYFENLTDAELGALAWALSLPIDGGKTGYHMLGMAKPFGLGVVKLIPTLYLSNRQARYQTLFDEGGGWTKAESETDYNIYIEKFCDELKAHGIDFIKQPRIREFITMLIHMANADDEQYQYMTIDEYKHRPVLPRPHQVVKGNTT